MVKKGPYNDPSLAASIALPLAGAADPDDSGAGTMATERTPVPTKQGHTAGAASGTTGW
jgi:hypothetical protein